jgi:hypothetical protein
MDHIFAELMNKNKNSNSNTQKYKILSCQKTIDNKRQTRIKCYDIILNKVHKKIINNSKLETSYCMYAIPEYIIGLPIINNKECTEYIIDSLKKNGFMYYVLT